MSSAAARQLAELAETIISQMKEGAETWYMPWHKGLQEPVNALTGRVFQGRNAAILWNASTQRNYQKNEWATLHQWGSKGKRIRAGAKGVRVFAPILHKAPDLFDGESDALAGFRSYHVFNEQEVKNYNPEHPDLFADFFTQDVDEHIEQLVTRSKADIEYSGDKACYMPSRDKIYMPPRNTFVATPHASATEGFYSTLVHELTHWTKKEGRSTRSGPFDDSHKNYAFEELIAELGSAIICSRFNQKIQPRPDHAAYLNGWLSVLEHDFRYFYRALYQAQSSVHWLYRYTAMVPDGWVLDDPAAEKAEPGYQKPFVTAVEAARFVELQSDASGFKRTARLQVVCGDCQAEYRVVITRGEHQSACQDCHRINLHTVEW